MLIGSQWYREWGKQSEYYEYNIDSAELDQKTDPIITFPGTYDGPRHEDEPSREDEIWQAVLDVARGS